MLFNFPRSSYWENDDRWVELYTACNNFVVASWHMPWVFTYKNAQHCTQWPAHLIHKIMYCIKFDLIPHNYLTIFTIKRQINNTCVSNYNSHNQVLASEFFTITASQICLACNLCFATQVMLYDLRWQLSFNWFQIEWLIMLKFPKKMEKTLFHNAHSSALSPTSLSLSLSLSSLSLSSFLDILYCMLCFIGFRKDKKV